MPQDPAQGPQVAKLHDLVEHRVGRFLLVHEEERAEDRRQRHRHQEGAADGERIGIGHRTKKRPLGPGHREQRDERADDDRRGEQECSLDLARRLDDPVDQGPRSVDARRGHVPVDVLDDDRRAVDDDSKVDRADRQQVGRLALHVEYGDREQQGQRDHDRHDARAGQVTQENEENGDHQPHADQQVMQHVMGRHVDQLGALVENP